MANPNHLATLRRGIAHWNEWRIQHVDTAVDLREADLRHRHISDAILTGADLRDADLRGADLARADLRFADLSRANLTEANLSEALVGWTTFGNLDLSAAIGLEAVRHSGPSTVGVDTLMVSHRRISQQFLTQAGVPDSMLVGHRRPKIHASTPYYSCFISHASADSAFASKLHTDLVAAGVCCWYAPADLRGGQKLDEQVRNAIWEHDKLLLILSQASINSRWVETEIWETRQLEVRNGTRKLFPISLLDFDVLRGWRCFDGDTGCDLAREVRSYYIPDFSHWQDESAYNNSLSDLLTTLVRELHSHQGHSKNSHPLRQPRDR